MAAAEFQLPQISRDSAHQKQFFTTVEDTYDTAGDKLSSKNVYGMRHTLASRP